MAKRNFNFYVPHHFSHSSVATGEQTTGCHDSPRLLTPLLATPLALFPQRLGHITAPFEPLMLCWLCSCQGLRSVVRRHDGDVRTDEARDTFSFLLFSNNKLFSPNFIEAKGNFCHHITRSNFFLPIDQSLLPDWTMIFFRHISQC